jgi:hypothetical protein
MRCARRHRWLGRAAAVLLAAVAAPVAAAAWSSQITAGPLPLSSETLVDPTNLAATNNKTPCKRNRASTLEVDLSWTATVSTNAGGYRVYRTNNSTGVTTQVATVTPVGAAVWNDTTGALAFSTSYTYKVQTYVQSWTTLTGGAAVAITTLNSNCA